MSDIHEIATEGAGTSFVNPFNDSKDRWWFHDESYVSWGPFEDKEIAGRMLALYGKVLEGGPSALNPPEFLEYFARCCMRGQSSPLFQERMMWVLDYVVNARQMSERIRSDLHESLGVIRSTLHLHEVILKEVFAALPPHELKLRVGEVIQASFIDAELKAEWIKKVVDDFQEFVRIGKTMHPYEKCAHIVGGFMYNDLEGNRESVENFLHYWANGMWAELDAHFPEWKVACDRELSE